MFCTYPASSCLRQQSDRQNFAINSLNQKEEGRESLLIFKMAEGIGNRKEEGRSETSNGGQDSTWITYSLVGADRVDLGAKHHRGKDEEEETLKAQEDEEDDCSWRREGTALWWVEGHGGRDVKGQMKNCYTLSD